MNRIAFIHEIRQIGFTEQNQSEWAKKFDYTETHFDHAYHNSHLILSIGIATYDNDRKE